MSLPRSGGGEAVEPWLKLYLSQRYGCRKRGGETDSEDMLLMAKVEPTYRRPWLDLEQLFLHPQGGGPAEGRDFTDSSLGTWQEGLFQVAMESLYSAQPSGYGGLAAEFVDWLPRFGGEAADVAAVGRGASGCTSSLWPAPTSPPIVDDDASTPPQTPRPHRRAQADDDFHIGDFKATKAAPRRESERVALTSAAEICFEYDMAMRAHRIDREMSYIIFAIDRGHEEHLTVLLEAGDYGDIDAHCDGWRALHFAMTYCHRDVGRGLRMTEMLLRQGASANALSEDTDAPLLVAASRCEFGLLPLLLRFVADPHVLNTYSRTPLHVLNKGRDPTAPGGNEKAYKEGISELLRRGVDSYRKDRFGKTAQEYCKSTAMLQSFRAVADQYDAAVWKMVQQGFCHLPDSVRNVVGEFIRPGTHR
eukprot:TRINITY_DN1163_c0_g2_i1.p1 TRINITY_DN1163_c0_g2~~TRINITY_DN1163_c0_g2_i1.p1  ORF type:complete len:419 (-),score=54.91 TRINITY_DN1163_c0_g2_i1:201-1457(-)